MNGLLFYCNNKAPWIIKNMAEHCFITRFKDKRQKIQDLTSLCLHFYIYKLVDITEDPFPEKEDECIGYIVTDTVTNENDKRECTIKHVLKQRFNKICVE